MLLASVLCTVLICTKVWQQTAEATQAMVLLLTGSSKAQAHKKSLSGRATKKTFCAASLTDPSENTGFLT